MDIPENKTALNTKLTPSQVDEYLSRIRYTGSIARTARTLFALQRAHLLSVPFENLDIHLGRPIRLEVEALYSKLVTQLRGGFCYELNGLFAGLLEALGYQVIMVNARSLEDDGSYGPEYDHLALQVLCPDDSTPWLVDAGWGNGPFEPLNLLDTHIQRQGNRAFQLQQEGDYFVLAEQLEEDGRWIKHYAFTQQPHTLQDFSACCQYHQTSPNSIFTRKRICSIYLEDGYITLSDSPSGGCRLITTRRGGREERSIRGETEFRQVLRYEFGVDIVDM